MHTLYRRVRRINRLGININAGRCVQTEWWVNAVYIGGIESEIFREFGGNKKEKKATQPSTAVRFPFCVRKSFLRQRTAPKSDFTPPTRFSNLKQRHGFREWNTTNTIEPPTNSTRNRYSKYSGGGGALFPRVYLIDNRTG